MKSNLPHQVSASSWPKKQEDLAKILYLYLIVIISFYYAYTIAYIPMDGIMDRDNYLNHAENAQEIFSRWNGLSSLFNEPVWLIINDALGKILNSPESVIQTYIFISAFIVSFAVLQKNKTYFFYLLTIPFLWQVMNNYVVHLRQGLAISIFLIGFFSVNKKIRYILFIIASLVHSSFFVIIFILLFDHYSKKIISANYKRYALQYLFFATISVSIIYIAHILGARQGSVYIEASSSISGFGFLFWLIVLMIYITDTQRFQHRNSFQISIILFYLAGYFTLPVIARIFESGLILILISAIELSRNRKYLFFSLYAVYFSMQSVSSMAYFIDKG